jgi:hypothetical protein
MEQVSFVLLHHVTVQLIMIPLQGLRHLICDLGRVSLKSDIASA